MISSSVHGPGVAIGNYHALANHALHSALAAVSLRTLGNEDAELALRLPAFLAGVACIPAMFNLGRAIAGDRLGLIAAAVVAVGPAVAVVPVAAVVPVVQVVPVVPAVPPRMAALMVRPRASTAVERRENPADSIGAAAGIVVPVVARMPAGANAEAAGVLPGDILRATTAVKQQMEMPTWQLLGGGIGRPRLFRFVFGADLDARPPRTFEEVLGAVASNRMDQERRPAILVVERPA